MFLHYGFNLHSMDNTPADKIVSKIEGQQSTSMGNNANLTASVANSVSNDKKQNDAWGIISQNSTKTDNLNSKENSVQVDNENLKTKEKEDNKKKYQNIGKNSTFSKDGKDKWPLSRRAKKQLRKKNEKQIEAKQRRRKYIKENVLYWKII